MTKEGKKKESYSKIQGKDSLYIAKCDSLQFDGSYTQTHMENLTAFIKQVV